MVITAPKVAAKEECSVLLHEDPSIMKTWWTQYALTSLVCWIVYVCTKSPLRLPQLLPQRGLHKHLSYPGRQQTRRHGQQPTLRQVKHGRFSGLCSGEGWQIRAVQELLLFFITPLSLPSIRQMIVKPRFNRLLWRLSDKPPRGLRQSLRRGEFSDSTCSKLCSDCSLLCKQ